MAKDTITLALNGEVTIHDFASAVSNLETLVHALSEEFGVADKVEWIVHDLQAGSAIATIRGETDVAEQAERVVEAYASVGKALQAGKRPDFSEQVVRAANGITKVLSDRVTSIRFETPDLDVTVAAHPDIASASATVKSLGALEGRVQTLSNRKGLRFNLYDTLLDRAVSCYVQEGKEDLMRQIWGRRAIVEGEIHRDAITGRPIAVRRISSIRVLAEGQRGSYLVARGIAPREVGAPRAEEVIRQLRDA